ncbi:MULTISPECIES: hypothetical protein [unclassified Caballeronia]|uniref:hypothetical protein n=1 Tax=unclassified Caballeronia TaxID=2646786 RepID=UPI00285E0705|nr:MULTISPECIES: hypothetical protein [unclassified Caballeronia]MDR5740573.1 hypothetical protein [Caballeronia sp. LZ016]MDR5808906.1 hypothetical protein [Caballeronia sp. LZ019]
MKTHNEKTPSMRREVFRCSGEQLDAILRFAEERRLDERPLQWVVAQYFLSPVGRA